MLGRDTADVNRQVGWCWYYMNRSRTKRRTPPSQTWSTFPTNHVRDLVSIDFFAVPTAGLRVLFVLVVLAHHRRRVVHFNFNVTEHSTAHSTSQQIVNARATPRRSTSSAIATTSMASGSGAE
jgi:hypothetical protein